MKLYQELADWWPLLSAPQDYEEEAHLFQKIIAKHKKDVQHVLELGSGGGNNASYLKKYYNMTLSDLSSNMIRISKRLNPECDHIVGDMRALKLNKTFDCVFIHDAIMYITSEKDLVRVFEVAHHHLNKEGILFIVPDFFKETFQPHTSHGGHDEPGRGLRYLEWTSDKNSDDNLVETEYVYILKGDGKETKVIHDPITEGIFSQSVWLQLLQGVGFEVSFEVINHTEVESNTYIGIIGIKK